MRALLLDTVAGREFATWHGLTIVANDDDAALLAAQFSDDLHPEPTEAPAEGTISFVAWLTLTHVEPPGDGLGSSSCDAIGCTWVSAPSGDPEWLYRQHRHVAHGDPLPASPLTLRIAHG